MDIKLLSRIVFLLGVAILIIAVIWWFNFYSDIVGNNGKLEDAFICLYSSDGGCSFVSGLARFGGATPYEPLVFWVGLVFSILGFVINYSAKIELRQDEIVIKQGSAKPQKGIISTWGGKLYLTNQRITFEANFGFTSGINIELSKIHSLEKSPVNAILINEYKFVVSNREKWISEINSKIKLQNETVEINKEE